MTARYFRVMFNELEEGTRQEVMWCDYYEVLEVEGGYRATLFWWNDPCADQEDYIEPSHYGIFPTAEQAISAFYS